MRTLRRLRRRFWRRSGLQILESAPALLYTATLISSHVSRSGNLISHCCCKLLPSRAVHCHPHLISYQQQRYPHFSPLLYSAAHTVWGGQTRYKGRGGGQTRSPSRRSSRIPRPVIRR